ncbi:MAG: hypothetical protein K2Q17_02015 [Nitrospiraceae bacterium]|jgi:hypothetical protein|uniref:hypothetical protein n=1 Tax=Nitrospira cf. moscoviensis SBR1015 TaxID=96242 RepID=UPI001120FD86|nr:hypothetical protein [Nitrospira cf. moscoviensis SBR1015]MBY0246415.1 hypothetical protein [Nitrospiraceae bacterium]
MTDPIREEVRRQIDVLVPLLLPYVAPVLVYPRVSPGIDGWITGGTVLFARTGQNRFLITADHFVTEIDKLIQGSDVVALLGVPGASFTDITTWPVIARDNHVDICTIQIPQEAECEWLEKHCFDLDCTQSIRACVGDKALIMGFPKLHREAGKGRINTRVLPILDYVTDVSDRRFTIADENARREILINPHNLSFPDHVGGMSGAPVFRVSASAPPSLIGVLSESGDGLRGVHFCAHAHFIMPDGSLDLVALPPR